MCLVSTPNTNTTVTPPSYLHNTFLDGAAMSGMGANQGRNNLVTTTNGVFGKGSMPNASAVGQTSAPVAKTPAPQTNNGGLTMGAGTTPPVGQPGVVMPTVGGVGAGLMGGRISPSTPPASALMGRGAGAVK